uniref:NFACT RNA-binding domain-containing protein n=1 Tax=viral metagenome TaxID=1070528 RepID=A0A6C0EGE4_9ZZZZ
MTFDYIFIIINIMTNFPTIIIGKNAKDNWRILEEACEDDLWFHVKDESSSYVIIENDYKTAITDEDIEEAAQICKQHSKLRDKKRVHINWLPVKYVKKGKMVGQAIMKKEPNTMRV